MQVDLTFVLIYSVFIALSIFKCSHIFKVNASLSCKIFC